MTPKVISFFCGCGGSSYGYRLAGCDIALACDWEKSAIDIYNHNFPDTQILREDIRKVNYKVIYDLTGINKYELDILDGSPPCTPFSTCGIREQGWGKDYIHTGDSESQRADDLFFEYIRIIDEMMPKTFVAENVSGLIKGYAKGYYKEIISQMKKLGYNLQSFLLNAADYEVPQRRERIIIIGYRDDLQQNESVKLKKFPHRISFYEATKNLVNPPDELIYARRLKQSSISYYYSATQPGYSVGKIHPKGHCFNTKRERLDKPISTLVASGINLIHPTEDRYLTLAECKRCATFPDNFYFPSIHQGYQRIGNSVPPNLIKNVAKYVIQRANL